uniref:PUB 62/63 C-terminal domain-containing protein n=1 Tax=Cannabis sativa TaxID=3483 RepID=A0A803Q2C5_CANSA
MATVLSWIYLEAEVCSFHFFITDRVIIKGNKRTPQRFVGREAVVTTQCLNGWYVVKTLDNAESVKLQYRSLAKVSDDPIPKPMSSKMVPIFPVVFLTKQTGCIVQGLVNYRSLVIFALKEPRNEN